MPPKLKQTTRSASTGKKKQPAKSTAPANSTAPASEEVVAEEGIEDGGAPEAEAEGSGAGKKKGKRAAATTGTKPPPKKQKKTAPTGDDGADPQDTDVDEDAPAATTRGRKGKGKLTEMTPSLADNLAGAMRGEKLVDDRLSGAQAASSVGFQALGQGSERLVMDEKLFLMKQDEMDFTIIGARARVATAQSVLVNRLGQGEELTGVKKMLFDRLEKMNADVESKETELKGRQRAAAGPAEPVVE